jgi:prepilin-type N-terminal cleavage/methylation domain-containing protein
MSISTALKARREALADREAGFTLIELLVVVLIIGILAAIAIPVYLGVQNNAKDSGVQSDMAADKTAVVAYLTNNPSVSTSFALTGTSAPAELKADGFTFDATKYASAPAFKADAVFTGTAPAWCIDAISKQNTAFRVSSGTGVAKGTCTQLTKAN